MKIYLSLVFGCFLAFRSTGFREWRTYRLNQSSSGLYVAKFNPEEFITVHVKKPLGVTLFEFEENAKRGVYIGEIDNEGSLAQINRVKKGLYLLKINDKDVKFQDFDTVIDYLVEIPESQEIGLTFIDPKVVEVGPASVRVRSPGKEDFVINTRKGESLRKVLLANNVDLYDMKGKFSNCGGGGICGTCVVAINDNNDWEEKPEFEKKKLNKYSENCRLSCNTVIEGDCTVTIQPKPK